MPTKTEFLATYRELLERGMAGQPYPWTKVEGKLDRFMASVANTIRSPRETTWNFNSEAAKRAWKIIHGKNPAPRYSLKAMRALSDGEVTEGVTSDADAT